MSVERICIRDVDYTEPNEPVRQAAGRMRDHNIGMLVVCNNSQRPVGVLTDRDLAIRVVAAGRDADRLTVADVMTKNVIWVQEATSIEMALQSMRAGPCRRLPVVDEDGHLVGLVTLDDALSWLADELNAIRSLLNRESPEILAVR